MWDKLYQIVGNKVRNSAQILKMLIEMMYDRCLLTLIDGGALFRITESTNTSKAQLGGVCQGMVLRSL